MLDVVLELVDDAGHPVEPGGTGHVVVTRLHAGASPLVRYRTGDLAVRASGPCPCGRPGLVIARVLGRLADTLVTPTGRRLIVPFLTASLDRCTDIEGFQVVKTHADRLELRIEVRDAATARTPPASVVAAADELALAIPDMRMQIRLVDRLPVTSGGKLRFVLDESESEE
jgi:phenylacetate-CoA ligase